MGGTGRGEGEEEWIWPKYIKWKIIEINFKSLLYKVGKLTTRVKKASIFMNKRVLS